MIQLLVLPRDEFQITGSTVAQITLLCGGLFCAWECNRIHELFLFSSAACGIGFQECSVYTWAAVCGGHMMGQVSAQVKDYSLKIL
jgi:hypothetical protein